MAEIRDEVMAASGVYVDAPIINIMLPSADDKTKYQLHEVALSRRLRKRCRSAAIVFQQTTHAASSLYTINSTSIFILPSQHALISIT
jgi:hypothetical protein